jgi:hypothetical protein
MIKLEDDIEKLILSYEINLVARAKTWPVAWLRMSQSRRIPFFPDAPTHVSISTISPLQDTFIYSLIRTSCFAT